MTPNSDSRGVETTFSLPHNTEWTMADEWAVTERQCRNISYRTEPYRAPGRRWVGRPQPSLVAEVRKIVGGKE
jgi:hypothetical protein